MYNNIEQIQIFKNCDSALELLKCRELLEEIGDFNDLSLIFYNGIMNELLNNI